MSTNVDDLSYEEFIEECCEHCNCDNKPCDSVLAGGLCDTVEGMEAYNPDDLRHQTPVGAISEWQQWNDFNGTEP